MSSQESYCGDIFWKINIYYYENIYVNIVIPMCLAGMISNLLNVLVFTRKTMNSPPNLILVHLALVDFLYLLSNIAQFWVECIQFKSYSDMQQSYGWTIFDRYIDIFIGSVQFISIFLTMQMAAWRYIAVVHPLKQRNWCTKKITRNVVIIGYVICCVLYTIPYYLSHDIKTSSKKGKTYYIDASERHPFMRSIRHIFYGIVIKIFPSFVLAGFTSRIIVALLARKPHREILSPSASIRKDMKNVETRRKTNRSTAMLLAVVALFFVSEFPRGLLWFLRTINEHDWGDCYDSLVQIFMTLTYINASITFIVYYTLSQKFRTTFKSLFNLNKRTISHQTHTPVALGDTIKKPSRYRRKTSQV